MASCVGRSVLNCWDYCEYVCTCCGMAGRSTMLSFVGRWSAAIAMVIYIWIETFLSIIGAIIQIIKNAFNGWKTLLYFLLAALFLYLLMVFWEPIIAFVIAVLIPILNIIVDIWCLLTDILLLLLRIVFMIWNILVPFIGMILYFLVEIVAFILKAIFQILGALDLVDLIMALFKILMAIVTIIVKILMVFIEVGMEILQVVMEIVMPILEVIFKVIEVLLEMLTWIFKVLWFVLEPILDALVALVGGIFGIFNTSATSRNLLWAENGGSPSMDFMSQGGIPEDTVTSKFMREMTREGRKVAGIHDLPYLMRRFKHVRKYAERSWLEEGENDKKAYDPMRYHKDHLHGDVEIHRHKKKYLPEIDHYWLFYGDDEATPEWMDEDDPRFYDHLDEGTSHTHLTSHRAYHSPEHQAATSFHPSDRPATEEDFARVRNMHEMDDRMMQRLESAHEFGSNDDNAFPPITRKLMSTQDSDDATATTTNKTVITERDLKMAKRSFGEEKNGKRGRHETHAEMRIRVVRKNMKIEHPKTEKHIESIGKILNAGGKAGYEVYLRHRRTHAHKSIIDDHVNRIMVRHGINDRYHGRDILLEKTKNFVDDYLVHESYESFLESISLENFWLHRYFKEHDPNKDTILFWSDYKRLVKDGSLGSSELMEEDNTTLWAPDNAHPRKLMLQDLGRESTKQKVPSASGSTSAEGNGDVPLIASADCFSTPRNPLCMPDIPENFTLCPPLIKFWNITGREPCEYYMEDTNCVFCWARVWNAFTWFRVLLTIIIVAVLYIMVIGVFFPPAIWVVKLLLLGDPNDTLTIVDYACLVKHLYDVVIVSIVIYLFYNLMWPLVKAIYDAVRSCYDSYHDFHDLVEEQRRKHNKSSDFSRDVAYYMWDSRMNPGRRSGRGDEFYPRPTVWMGVPSGGVPFNDGKEVDDDNDGDDDKDNSQKRRYYYSRDQDEDMTLMTDMMQRFEEAYSTSNYPEGGEDADEDSERRRKASYYKNREAINGGHEAIDNLSVRRSMNPFSQIPVNTRIGNSIYGPVIQKQINHAMESKYHMLSTEEQEEMIKGMRAWTKLYRSRLVKRFGTLEENFGEGATKMSLSRDEMTDFVARENHNPNDPFSDVGLAHMRAWRELVIPRMDKLREKKALISMIKSV